MWDFAKLQITAFVWEGRKGAYTPSFNVERKGPTGKRYSGSSIAAVVTCSKKKKEKLNPRRVKKGNGPGILMLPKKRWKGTSEKKDSESSLQTWFPVKKKKKLHLLR